MHDIRLVALVFCIFSIMFGVPATAYDYGEGVYGSGDFDSDSDPPQVINVTTQTINATATLVTFNISEYVNTTIYYGEDQNLTLNATNLTFYSLPSFALSGLNQTTLYYFNATFCDHYYQCNNSELRNFTTVNPPPAPDPDPDDPGGSSPSGSSSSFVPPPECTEDENCTSSQACTSGSCQDINCTCGYIQNRTCISYECCDNSSCSEGMTCEDHACLTVEDDAEVTKEQSSQTDVQDVPDESAPDFSLPIAVAGIATAVVVAVSYVKKDKLLKMIGKHTKSQ